jgi:hypothetical protein
MIDSAALYQIPARPAGARRFERVTGRSKAERLHCLVYVTAARSAVPINFDHRIGRLRTPRAMIRPPSISQLLA